jgi:hypothetical protein
VMSRRFLTTLVAVMVLVGCVFIATLFGQSLGISDSAKANLLAVDIDKVPLGGYTSIDRPGERIYLLRPDETHLYAISVQKWGNAFWLPESASALTGPCENFGLDNVSGRLLEGGYFRCLDAAPEGTFFATARWGYEGIAQLNERWSRPGNLLRVPYERDGTLVLLRRPASDRNGA